MFYFIWLCSSKNLVEYPYDEEYTVPVKQKLVKMKVQVKITKNWYVTWKEFDKE